MRYRRLGHTDLEVSVVGVGTWQFGGEWGQTYSPTDVRVILDHARDRGINLIDTAECYGDHLSESLIGEAIEGSRSEWIIATKFGHRFHGHLQRTEHWSPAEVVSQLDASLRALRTDYIDLYQFHSGDDVAFAQDELWDCLQRQVRAGKVRHLGNSIADSASSHQTARSRDVGVSSIQVVYNWLDRAPECTVLPTAQSLGLGVLVREPLASGLLSGKYETGVRFDTTGDWRATEWPRDVLDGRLRAVDELRRTLPAGTPLSAWALAWILRNPAVTAVIPGCRSAAQVDANALAVELLPVD